MSKCQECNNEKARYFCEECGVYVGSKCKHKHPNLVKVNSKGVAIRTKSGLKIYAQGCGDRD